MKKYLCLILVIAIPLVLICAYSFYKKDISIFGITLTKADIAPHFQTGSDDAPADDPETPTVAPTAANNPENDPVILDTLGQRILFFGDSMIESLGKRMNKYAAENGHEMLNVIWYSSTTKVWAQNIDTLSHFIRGFRPTYVFVCLGANELFVSDVDKRDRFVKTILSRIDSIPFLWIGPPNWKDDTGINDVILKNTGKRRFFPSKNLTYERASDGAHPTVTSAAKWMDSVAVWMTDSINRRILMQPPTSNRSAGKTVLLQPVN